MIDLAIIIMWSGAFIGAIGAFAGLMVILDHFDPRHVAAVCLGIAVAASVVSVGLLQIEGVRAARDLFTGF